MSSAAFCDRCRSFFRPHRYRSPIHPVEGALRRRIQSVFYDSWLPITVITSVPPADNLLNYKDKFPTCCFQCLPGGPAADVTAWEPWLTGGESHANQSQPALVSVPEVNTYEGIPAMRWVQQLGGGGKGQWRKCVSVSDKPLDGLKLNICRVLEKLSTWSLSLCSQEQRADVLCYALQSMACTICRPAGPLLCQFIITLHSNSLVDHRRWRLATADDHSTVFLLHCSLSCDISFSWM